MIVLEAKQINTVKQSDMNLNPLAFPQESSWCRVGFIAYPGVGELLASYLPS